MSVRTITAMFDSADSARVAHQRLLDVGVPSESVQVIDQGASGTRTDSDGKGLWESIKDMFTADDEDRTTYEEGIRRGGYLLTANVEDEYTDEVLETLENSDAIDLEQRSEQWRAEGWTGAAATTQQMDTTTSQQTGAAQSDMGSRDGSEEVIPVVQERLRVGKREVNRGGVRVRSYVVEEPIHEQVNLREERVDVERRPVRQRMQPGAADDLLRDRTIEMTESAEEAVVSKDAEVTEEVVVRKFEGERTEGVSDTVRHTEVEVDDTRDEETRDGTIPPAAGRSNTRRDRPSRH